MAVNTKQVRGRREIHFDSYDELLDDVHQLARGKANTVGNWTFAQILWHLAAGMDTTFDGTAFIPPWYFKLLGRWFLKNRFLTKPLPPGFTLPDKAREQLGPPDEITVEDAVAKLEQAIARQRGSEPMVDHSILGPLPAEDWTRFHLRHAELHLSFAESNSTA